MSVTAFHYRIIDAETSETLDSGIIADSEDTIYPGQNNPDEDYMLPYECDAHHFYQREGFTRKAILQIKELRLSEADIRRLTVEK